MDIGETAWFPVGEQDTAMGQLVSCRPNSFSQIELLAADRGRGEVRPSGVLWKVGTAPAASRPGEPEIKPGMPSGPGGTASGRRHEVILK